MNIKWKIIKPPIPIIILDTLFFIDLIKSKNSNKKSPYFDDELKLVDLIISLTLEEKLICPFGQQRQEYDLRNKYKEEIKKLQLKLSFGIQVKARFDVYRHQLVKAMEAYIKNKKEILCDYMCIFYEDPIKELRNIIRTLLVRGGSVINNFAEMVIETEKKIFREEIFEEMEREKIYRKRNFEGMEELREIVEEEQIKYEDLITNIESLDFMKQMIESALNKGIDKPLNDTDRFALSNLYNMIELYNYYSKKDVSIKDIFNFLESKYYASIPYLAILFKLFYSIYTQEGKVRISDIFDVKQTSQMLPFSTYFLTDSSLKHRLTTKPLEIDKEYDVKIFSMREIESLIKELERL